MRACIVPVTIAASFIDCYEFYDDLLAAGLTNASSNRRNTEIWDDQHLVHLVAQIQKDAA